MRTPTHTKQRIEWVK